MIDIKIEEPEDVLEKKLSPIQMIKNALTTEQTLHFLKPDFESLENKNVIEILNSKEFSQAGEKLKTEFLHNCYNREVKDYRELDTAPTDYILISHEAFGDFRKTYVKDVINLAASNGNVETIHSMLENPLFSNVFQTDSDLLKSQINDTNKDKINLILSNGSHILDKNKVVIDAGYEAMKFVSNEEELGIAKKSLIAISEHYPNYFNHFAEDTKSRWLDIEQKTMFQYELFKEPEIFDSLTKDNQQRIITNNIHCHRNGMFNRGYNFHVNGFLDKAIERNLMDEKQLHMITDAVIKQDDIETLKTIVVKTNYKLTEEQNKEISGNWDNSKEFFEFVEKANLNKKLTNTLPPKQKVKTIKL